MADKPRIVEARRTDLMDQQDIVVLLLWHLGDVLNATGLLPDLVARHSRKLTFATTKPCVPILENNPCLDKILVVDADLPNQVSLEHLVQVLDLCRMRFSAKQTVYNLHFPIYLRRRHLPMVRRWARIYDYKFPTYLRSTPLHLVECWGRAVGIEKSVSELKPDYRPAPTRSRSGPDRRVFVLGNGGMTGIKHWPAKRWRQLVAMIRTRFPKIRLAQLGSASDPPIESAEDLRGKTTIEETYDRLQNALGCVTNDSFIAHLSAISGCPTYVIYGSTSPTHVRPLGQSEMFLFGGGYRCTPCLRNWCLWTGGMTPCLAFPSAEEVFEKVCGHLETTLGVQHPYLGNGPS